MITVADALRPRQVATHHPGEAVARMADVLVINKVDAASQADIADRRGRRCGRSILHAPIVRAASPIRLDDPVAVKGRRVLVIEDGPTITHGGMAYGAGYLAAKAAARRCHRPSACGSAGDPQGIRGLSAYRKRAAGDGIRRGPAARARRDHQQCDVEVVVSATPVDLTRLLDINKKVVRARYEFAETGEPKLSSIVDEFVDRIARSGSQI